MSKSIYDIFDSLDDNELSELIEHEAPLPLPKDISAERIKGLALKKSGLKPKGNRRLFTLKRLAAAACAAVIIGAAAGGIAYAAGEREYREAMRFFSENELSAGGLSKGEVRAVYRDIKTNAFSYSKTAEVINHSLTTAAVSGYEIAQATPEDVKALWGIKSSGFWSSEREDVMPAYRITDSYVTDEKKGYEVLEQTALEHYEGDKLIWSVSFPSLEAEGWAKVSDGVIAYGYTPRSSSLDTSYPWLVKIKDGHTVWGAYPANGFQTEYIAAVIENDDGTLGVISRGDLRYLCVARYSANGERLSFTKTEVGNLGIWNAVGFQDGYLVQLGSVMLRDGSAKIVRIDGNGSMTDSFSYGGDDAYYYISAMAEFGGRIYLSGYSVPLLEDDSQSAGGRYEIAAVLNEIFKSRAFEIEPERLTELLRENYTALLLCCDPATGAPEEFFSVPGCRGSALRAENGLLLWDVESFADSFFSLATSSFTIGGTCEVFRYSFDESGALISRVDTGEQVIYRK